MDAITNAIMSVSPESQSLIKNILIWSVLFLVFKNKQRSAYSALFIGEAFAITIFGLESIITWLMGSSIVSSIIYIILSTLVLVHLL